MNLFEIGMHLKVPFKYNCTVNHRYNYRRTYFVGFSDTMRITCIFKDKNYLFFRFPKKHVSRIVHFGLIFVSFTCKFLKRMNVNDIYLSVNIKLI